ncbi:MAG TPA: hypothetical protein VHO68_07525, partial [Bacteroidales bacterium]|nr:hypothetical protein [Bacteroidales bacterium]
MMKKLTKLSVVLIFFLSNTFGQVHNNEGFQVPLNFPSPNAASLGTFGTIPISHFTGTPSISIPLYEIDYGGIKVPLTLSYHISNVKVNAHPGWVGLGWVFQPGGIITRNVRGWADENRSSHFDIDYQSYFDAYYHLQATDWNTASGVERLSKGYNYTPDPVTHKYYDSMADQFTFNFLDYSGAFYLDHTGNWKVISDQYIIVEDIAYCTADELRQGISDHKDPWVEDANRFIIKFVLRTPDGSKFEFGGINATEYSVPFRDQRYAPTATSWYLTKITSPSGKEISFEYEANDTQNASENQLQTYINCSLGDYYYSTNTIPEMSSPSDPCWVWESCFLQPGCQEPFFSESFSDDANGFLILPVYLRKITFGSNEIEFNRSLSIQKRYKYN